MKRWAVHLKRKWACVSVRDCACAVRCVRVFFLAAVLLCALLAIAAGGEWAHGLPPAVDSPHDGLSPAGGTITKSASGEVRLLFVGDISLSRQVGVEIERTHQHPWKGWPKQLGEMDWMAGNLEGAVGRSSECLDRSGRSPCFAIPETFLALLREAGFRAVGLANNHSDDLGRTGRVATRHALAGAGLGALSFENSPTFWRFGTVTVGVVACSMVPGVEGQRVEVPSSTLGQKLRLARRLAQLVVVYVHWGSELLDWPSTDQLRASEWMVEQGADLIVGHHPHVVQAFRCVHGKPVFYSLGNHLFDQKYPATKEGIIADCRVLGGRLRCSVIPTHTPAGSAFPQVKRDASPPPALDAADLSACCPRLGPGLIVGGRTLMPVPADPLHPSRLGEVAIEAVENGRITWKTRPVPLLAIDTGNLEGPDGPPMLFTLERHASSLDGEVAPRPYVYEVTSRGLVPRWRGTALAWPLIDAALLPGSNGILCALHRGGSYLIPNSHTSDTRVAAYRWNGFGFSGLSDLQIIYQCKDLLGAPKPGQPRKSFLQ